MVWQIPENVILQFAIREDQKLRLVSDRKRVLGNPLLGEGIGVIRYFDFRLQFALFCAKIHNCPRKKKSLKTGDFQFFAFHNIEHRKFTIHNIVLSNCAIKICRTSAEYNFS